ncbi:MAG TPA: MATE family efflux transporter, partial [Phaeodactylibacter sp.]|nr:MATE family efflux transporter [Phaeodactylibacter sp.]
RTLFQYGNEVAVAMYGIINRVMMFANFPVLGITQGFMPIAGYNFGAGKLARVRSIINYSILWYAFPVSDVLAVLVTYGYLRLELKRERKTQFAA